MKNTTSDLLREIANTTPFVAVDGGGTLACHYCGRESHEGAEKHQAGCLWLRVRVAAGGIPIRGKVPARG